MIVVNASYLFKYPTEFRTLPGYSEHRGQRVTVLRELESGRECAADGEAMFEVVASDGWRGHAFESELFQIE